MINSPHYNAFKKLKPLETDVEDAAVALELDKCLAEFDSIYIELFPGLTDATMAKWEDLYELSHTGSLLARRQALLSAINKDSGVAERHYIALAASLGFTVSIQKPFMMLRAGLGRAGFPVHSADEQYTWLVTCYATAVDARQLISTFESQKIPFTVIDWTFIYEGVLLDEESSLPIFDEMYPNQQLIDEVSQ